LTLFVDLHLLAPIENEEAFLNMLSKARKLGYKLVASPLRFDVSEQKIKEVKSKAENSGLDFVSRVDLAPKNVSELLRMLRKFRRKFELIGVLCRYKDVARCAARDRRVDLLCFPYVGRRFFDEAEAELASSSLASLEIDMTPVIEFEGIKRIRLLSVLRMEIEIAFDYDVPVVISSGAYSEHLMRKPREYAALASLFDMPYEKALKCISEIPESIVFRNREKLSPNYIAPGIRVVKWGSNCVKYGEDI